MARIVVGIDASEHARRALTWALTEARLRSASLELVHAFPTPELIGMSMVLTLPSDEELRTAADQVIDEVLAAAGPHDDVEVTRTVRSGGAASVLTEVAEGADLVVVGARGLGGFRGLLLGSVTQQVVAHAPCPVVVVTPHRD
jgi:nucleotide-binding universal stress UspA family protein